MSSINSVKSGFLAHLTDSEIRRAVVAEGAALIERVFPGRAVQANSLSEALCQVGGDFEVEKWPLLKIEHADGLDSPDAVFSTVESHVATARTDTKAQLGIVGTDYGVVQTADALQAVDILAQRGELSIQNVELIGNGARVRVTGLLGVTTLTSLDGAPNTLCHFGVFEASHDGNSSALSSLYTLRVECFNGMTSRSLIGKHTLRHTSKAADRAEAYTETVLATLLGDAEAERAIFASLLDRRMLVSEFEAFSVTLLGGPLEDDATQAKRTRRENEVEKLVGYFQGGNQGAGATAWGAYNSVTRWVEAKREGIEDAQKAARKFNSNVEGSGNATIGRALRLLQRY